MYHLTIDVVSYIVIYMYEYIRDNIQQDTTTAPQPVVEAPLYTMTPGGAQSVPRRNPGDTAMVGRPMAHPEVISPASIPWGPVTWVAPAIAEWTATLHFIATGRTDALAPWLASQIDRTEVDARRLIGAAMKWPLDNLAVLLHRHNYLGCIDYRGDKLSIVVDNNEMHSAAMAWVQRVYRRETGHELTGTRMRDWLLADADRYGDAVVKHSIAGISVPSRSHAATIAKGGSPIGTYLLYRIARAANARGMWTSPTAPAIAMPGGLVMRTMVWSGRPVELGRYGSAPEPTRMEGTDNGK